MSARPGPTLAIASLKRRFASIGAPLRSASAADIDPRRQLRSFPICPQALAGVELTLADETACEQPSKRRFSCAHGDGANRTGTAPSLAVHLLSIEHMFAKKFVHCRYSPIRDGLATAAKM